MRYDKELHANVTPDKIWMQGDVQMTHVMVCNFRFDFGTPRRYDPSGENHLTHGKPPVKEPCMTTDNNGMVRMEGRRNNPRETNEPHVSYNWGANSNTAPLFMSGRPDEHLHGLTREKFKSVSTILMPQDLRDWTRTPQVTFRKNTLASA